MITEDYVSFDTAKLLKEKGFDDTCRAFWKDWDGELHFCACGSSHMFEFCHNSMLENYNDNDETNIAAPTLQMAMKWLRENFNMDSVPYATSIGWYFEVFDLTQRDITGCALLYDGGIPSKEKTFETYEEACEAAIKYCLENLI